MLVGAVITSVSKFGEPFDRNSPIHHAFLDPTSVPCPWWLGCKRSRPPSTTTRQRRPSFPPPLDLHQRRAFMATTTRFSHDSSRASSPRAPGIAAHDHARDSRAALLTPQHSCPNMLGLVVPPTAMRRFEPSLQVLMSYLVLRIKPGTHRMCAQDHLFHTHRHKAFTNSQLSQIKYNYYINIVH
jgi:hypothetical protein